MPMDFCGDGDLDLLIFHQETYVDLVFYTKISGNVDYAHF